jgi:hypothetical protein
VLKYEMKLERKREEEVWWLELGIYEKYEK